MKLRSWSFSPPIMSGASSISPSQSSTSTRVSASCLPTPRGHVPARNVPLGHVPVQKCTPRSRPSVSLPLTQTFNHSTKRRKGGKCWGGFRGGVSNLGCGFEIGRRVDEPALVGAYARLVQGLA
eukprot:3606209-Rhodomonas_salina.1